MTNGVALPVCVTEILIYCWIEPFPAFLVKLICMYLTVWRSFHHTKLHAYTPSSLIKSNVEGGGGGGGGRYPWPHYGSVTPGLTMALLPLASLYGSVTSGLTMNLLPQAPHYGSVTPGLTMALLPQASLWLCYPCMASLWLCYPWPHYSSCACD